MENSKKELIIGPVLNMANYIKAVQRGYKTKQELARYFHVRKATLSDFEEKSGILELLSKYHYIQGASLSEIGQILHLRIRSIKAPHNLPTLDTVRLALNSILEVYREMAKYGDAETLEYNKLKRLADKL